MEKDQEFCDDEGSEVCRSEGSIEDAFPQLYLIVPDHARRQVEIPDLNLAGKKNDTERDILDKDTDSETGESYDTLSGTKFNRDHD